MMIKTIVGKYTFLLLLFVQGCLATDVSLKLFSTQGSELEQVQAGQPFIIQVAVSGSKTQDQPQLFGIESFHIVSSGYQMKMINGVTDTIYKYRATVDQKGTYTLGPAVVFDGTQECRSASLNLIVADEEKLVGGKHHKRPSDVVKLTLHVDKERVYKGQKVVATVRFYHPHNRIELQQVAPASVLAEHGIRISNAHGPYHGSERTQSGAQSYVEWHWDMYIDRLGELVIPAFSADFLIHENRHGSFGGFASFFSLTPEKKRIYSNTVKIEVMPLPDHQGPVHAVGVFSSYSAHIEPSRAKVGDGLLLTRQLIGQGGLQELVLPEWHGLPESFRCYESKNTCQLAKSQSHMYEKNVEYVVQGLEDGSFVIPEQSFTYFDTDKERYVTLKTDPLHVSLRPTHGPNKAQEKINDTKKEVSLFIDNELQPIFNNYWWPYSARYLKEKHFIVMLLLSVLVMILGTVRNRIHSLYTRKTRRHASGKAYEYAKKALDEARKNEDYATIYAIMMKALADRLHMPADTLTSSYIEHTLKQKGLDESELRSWQRFFVQIAEPLFAHRALTSFEKQDLFELAHRWITKLERII